MTKERIDTDILQKVEILLKGIIRMTVSERKHSNFEQLIRYGDVGNDKGEGGQYLRNEVDMQSRNDDA